jgi:hypothetical protein
VRTLAFAYLALSLGAIGVTACSSSKSKNGFEDPDASLLGDSGGGLGLGIDGGGNGGGCSDAAKLVYVLSDQNELYSFRPDILEFHHIGTLQCPAGVGAQPNSMAVDRTGTAWVNYGDGSLFRVSTADASCKATPFQPNQHGVGRFGMAFSSDSDGSTEETLYVCGIRNDPIGGISNGQGLAKIDLKTFVLTPLGEFSGALAGRAAELTGTGNGKLYGFFTTSPAQFAEIDKSTGATSSARTLPNVNTGTDWAFSFWGGDFWFYTADTGKSPLDTTNVTRLRTATDNSLGIAKSQIGFRIVGAGVSTCAPTSPVK